MSDDQTIPSMGNSRIDAAASRLNEAFLQITQKMERLQGQLSEHPEVDLLEKENMRLHEENAQLRELLNETNEQLAEMAEWVNQLMESAA